MTRRFAWQSLALRLAIDLDKAHICRCGAIVDSSGGIIIVIYYYLLFIIIIS